MYNTPILFLILSFLQPVIEMENISILECSLTQKTKTILKTGYETARSMTTESENIKPVNLVDRKVNHSRYRAEYLMTQLQRAKKDLHQSAVQSASILKWTFN